MRWERCIDVSATRHRSIMNRDSASSVTARGAPPLAELRVRAVEEDSCSSHSSRRRDCRSLSADANCSMPEPIVTQQPPHVRKVAPASERIGTSVLVDDEARAGCNTLSSAASFAASFEAFFAAFLATASAPVPLASLTFSHPAIPSPLSGQRQFVSIMFSKGARQRTRDMTIAATVSA